ncbi:hypothetical protein ACIBFB_09310 [Nocardiopsis sp. NPDC050513]|uniref:hypothetical protein n=1 Tax=Nocardiopsis sp. NPDC050513 TaxID=3364338 RepID=UPI0037AAAEE8
MKLTKHRDGPRPVFDPTLPADMLRGLREDAVGIREASRRLTRIGEYMRPVDAASTAHREWEQLSRLAGGTDDDADLVARTGSEPAGPLSHDLRGDPALHAARAAIEERVREAHEAAVWLTAATRDDHGSVRPRGIRPR